MTDDPTPTRLDRWETRYGRWQLAVALALVVQAASFFLYSYHFLPIERFNGRLTDTYAPLSADPFTTAPVGEPQVRHRILGPLIAYALGLRGPISFLPLIPATTAFLTLAYLLARRHLAAGAALAVVALLATTPAVQTSQAHLGFSDVLAHLATVVLMLVRSVWAVAPVLFLGMLGDERCAAVYPLVVGWHLLNRTDARPWRTAVLRSLAAAVAVAGWFAVLVFIRGNLMPTEDGATGTMVKQAVFRWWQSGALQVLPLGVYSGLRAAWLFPLLLLVIRPVPMRLPMLGLFAAATAVAVAPGLVVADLSRMVSFAWPAVVIAVVHLSRVSPARTGDWLLAAVLLNACTPQYNVVGLETKPQWPLPFQLLNAFRSHG